MSKTIPCGVPYWDSTEFLSKGGLYSETLGYHILEDAFRPPFEEWLPVRWRYRGDPPGPVLLPDMLPTSSWEANLRTALTEKEWDRLRRFCYAAAGNTCIACGSRGDPHLEAHEAWTFDEATKVQKLVALRCFCPTCHKAKHLGYAQRIGRYSQVIDRILELNEWSTTRLRTELERLHDRQERLSQIQWKLDLSFLLHYGVR